MNWSARLFSVVTADGPSAFRWGNVADANGIAIAITGMLIVFSALTLISAAIAALPHILRVIDPYLPTIASHQQTPPPAESLPTDEERVVAAIGMVLYAEMQQSNQP